MEKVQISVRVDKEIVERMKNTGYWLRKTITEMTESALGSYVGQCEREYGSQFPPRKKRK